MLGGLVRLILFRFFGARLLLVLAVLGWLRRMITGRGDRQAPTATGSDRRT